MVSTSIMRLCMKKVIDFQGDDVIMIEKPYTWGKPTKCSQNIHIMFVACLGAFGYIIGKESCGFLKIVKCSENMTA